MRIPAVAREIGGMMAGVLTGIARGELAAGKGRTAHQVDDTGFCTVRGADERRGSCLPLMLIWELWWS